MKKLFAKTTVLYFLTLLIIFPVLADSTSIRISANVVPVFSFSVETEQDNSFSVKSTNTNDEAKFYLSESIISFGKVDFAGINKGSDIIDQISSLNNNLLVPNENKVLNTGTVYIIGAPEDKYAVRIKLNCAECYNNPQVSFNKETDDELDLYYSYSDISWEEKYTHLGDLNHPSVSEIPSQIMIPFETGTVDLDFALKVTPTTSKGYHASTLVFTFTG